MLDVVPNMTPESSKLRITPGGWACIYVGRAANLIVAFSGVFSSLIVTGYPAYNVLMFSKNPYEQALSSFAQDQMADALFWLLISFSFALVSSCVIPARKLGLHLDRDENKTKLVQAYNSRLTAVFTMIPFFLSIVFAFLGYQAASKFFDDSFPACIQDPHSCPVKRASMSLPSMEANEAYLPT